MYKIIIEIDLLNNLYYYILICIIMFIILHRVCSRIYIILHTGKIPQRVKRRKKSLIVLSFNHCLQFINVYTENDASK